jgi:radical SAM protein with 4Fe4S-binding SPASM domain
MPSPSASLHESLRSHPRVLALADASWSRVSPIPPPHQVEIQPTARCHRTCVFCSHLQRNETGGELSEALVLSLVADLERMGVEAVGISGGGEPLIWNGSLAGVFAGVNRFAQGSLTTSGDQLWDDERGRLSDLAIDVLPACRTVLMNVPATDDAGLTMQIVGGPSWPRTRQLLSELVRFTAERGNRPEIRIVVVVSRRNARRLLDMDREFTSIGIRNIYYKELKMFEQPLRGLVVQRQTVSDALDDVDGGSMSEGLRRFRANLDEVELTPACCWMTRLGFNAIVDPHGDVFICTPTVGMADYQIGNVLDAPFTSIWGSPRHQQVIADLSVRSQSNRCPRECRHHVHNQIIQAITEGQGGDVRGHLVSNAGLDDAF